MGLIKVHPGAKNLFLGSVGIGGEPTERLSVAGNISATGNLSAASFSGDWRGNVLSGEYISVEGVDIKSTGQTEDLFLKSTGAGKVVWDTIDVGEEIVFNNQNIDGNLTVRGDIIEYAADGIVYSKTSVFSKSLTSGVNTLNTFDKTQFKTAKYVITLAGGTNRTACEVLVTHNGTTADGTTYGIVDAQATSLLTNINVSVGSSYIDLLITVSSDCTATVHGVAHY